MIRRSKFGNVRTEVDGISFASGAEANRYLELKLLVRAKEIRDLKLQPAFPIEVNGYKICKYIADFAYTEKGLSVIEDVKGCETGEFKIKWKLAQAIYGSHDWRIIKSGKQRAR